MAQCSTPTALRRAQGGGSGFRVRDRLSWDGIAHGFLKRMAPTISSDSERTKGRARRVPRCRALLLRELRLLKRLVVCRGGKPGSKAAHASHPRIASGSPRTGRPCWRRSCSWAPFLRALWRSPAGGRCDLAAGQRRPAAVRRGHRRRCSSATACATAGRRARIPAGAGRLPGGDRRRQRRVHDPDCSSASGRHQALAGLASSPLLALACAYGARHCAEARLPGRRPPLACPCRYRGWP